MRNVTGRRVGPRGTMGEMLVTIGNILKCGRGYGAYERGCYGRLISQQMEEKRENLGGKIKDLVFFLIGFWSFDGSNRFHVVRSLVLVFN